ncbi:MAG: TetM/TetW/TetO/TetS family tetracycline resistance ribosomal protection protein [Roseburia sp.]|nr:TetM/TetW/TetO/TetS family tetracycline resistance ribosomal protection protein [Roseburia sp.]
MNEKTKHICIGILAHVDAGKTTLSEALLYRCGVIKDPGRVDHQNTFLDTSGLERERGITIFSSQARMSYGNMAVTLLDTPGHVDFSAEMERTLQVIDYAVLVISGADGVQGHTETLWRLLEQYEIPCFLFVNKMDLPGTEKEKLMKELQNTLSDGCVDFSGTDREEFAESIALCDEKLMESYLKHGGLELEKEIPVYIRRRKIFPCFFGSALKLEGVTEFLSGLEEYTTEEEWRKEFGARVFKISRDSQGVRLTHMRVTGGELRVRMPLLSEEKVNQIRLYSGEKYETTGVVKCGEICCVTGMDTTYPGQGFGGESDFSGKQLEPVLRYNVVFAEGTEITDALKKLRQLEEEDPKLHLFWDERVQQLFIQPMGEVQLEVLQSVIKERFDMEVQFGEGAILYRETIRNTVEGVGHFEPLRHYAEVHLLLEPLPAGSGLVIAADCSEDKLDLNWQRLVLTHLSEKEFAGVLTGSPVTDLKITLAAGRAHQKHTEGGDFRQATYRAVRQGLMQAESVLLEPFYEFRMEVPAACIGRAMSDIKRMCGEFELLPEQGESAVITGTCPVSTMKTYPSEVASYTKGRGRITCSFCGYRPCHNAEEVIEQIAYDCERDVENTPDSVFCTHGSGFIVKWDEVKDHMHVESVLQEKNTEKDGKEPTSGTSRSATDNAAYYAEEKELEAIFERTFGPVKRRLPAQEIRVIKGKPEKEHVAIREQTPMEEYLLVDGYNIIFAWEELKRLSEVSLDAARTKLMDILCNYQGYAGCHLIVVFDAYKVKGNPGSIETYHNISVVYTKEAETADMYIEKTTKKIAKKHRVRVATSDGMEQMIILGHGASRLSASAFREEVMHVKEQIQDAIQTGDGGIL